MEDYDDLVRSHKRGDLINTAIFIAGVALLLTDFGMRAWLLGLFLLLYATTWHGITSVGMEIIERLVKLESAVEQGRSVSREPPEP